MRTSKSIKNAIVAFISNALTIIIAFVAQTIFIKYLGKEFSGINSLFSNIVSMLGVVELGLGTALIYHLYEPIAKNNIDKISTLMRFYKRCYIIIAIVVFILSLLLLPILHFFVTTSLDINIYFIFLLFAIESSCSYLLSYKRSILFANQDNYVVNIIRIFYILFLNASQIIVLILTKNYILYLLLKILLRILENIAITVAANKKYPYINYKDAKPINTEDRKSIFEKVKGLLFHKIGSYIVLGTDNIIISKFIGIITVGYYSNYIMITNGLVSLFSQIFYSITASIGNLLVEKNCKKSFQVYKNINFINFWISCFCCISFYIVSKPFVNIWLGNDFILSDIIVFTIMIKLYLDIYGYTIGAFKSAAGVFYEDRIVPILQSIANIIVSVVLVKLIGLSGVVIGTIISSFILYFYSYPKFVYSKLFEKSFFSYYGEFFKNFCFFAIIFISTCCIDKIFTIQNNYLNLLLSALICIIVPNILIVVLFHKTDEYQYFKNLIISKTKKILHLN